MLPRGRGRLRLSQLSDVVPAPAVDTPSASPAGALTGLHTPPSSFSDLDFARLYNSVRPNHLSVDSFRSVVLRGQTDSHYTAQAMQKFASAARDILHDHGRLAEGAPALWRGTKAEIARRLRTAALAPSTTVRTGGATVVVAPLNSAPDAFSNYSTPTFYPDPQHLKCMQPSTSGPSASVPSNLPFGAAVGSIAEGPTTTMPRTTVTAVSAYVSAPSPFGAAPSPVLQAAGLSTVPRPTVASQGPLLSPFSFVTPAIAPPSTAALSSSKGVGSKATTTGSTNASSTCSFPSPPPTTTSHSATFWSVVGSLCSDQQCLKGYQPYCSPLLPIIFEMKRLHLRAGCSHCAFDIPQEHFADIVARKKRVLAVPLQGGYQPMVWPKETKDMYVYVNGEPFNQRWKRSWPRSNLATSYLPIDVTQVIDKRKPLQRIQFDCFAKEYNAAVAIVVACQVSEIDLAERLSHSFTRPHDLALMYRRMAGDEVKVRSEDDDDDVVEAAADSMATVCPVSRGRLSMPVRGSQCTHIQPTDLAPYLRTGHTGCYWNCPTCDAPMRGDGIVIDYHLASALRDLSIPRSWQRVQVRRRVVGAGAASLSYDAVPRGHLLDVTNYQWVQSTRKFDVTGLDSEDESDGPLPLGGAGGSPHSPTSQGSQSGAASHRKKAIEVVSLDD